jgi:hypothetical protein
LLGGHLLIFIVLWTLRVSAAIIPIDEPYSYSGLLQLAMYDQRPSAAAPAEQVMHEKVYRWSRQKSKVQERSGSSLRQREFSDEHVRADLPDYTDCERKTFG